MEWLVWLGAVVSVLGLGVLLWCIAAVIRAKRAELSDEEMRLRLRRAVATNLAAFLTSILGLLMIVTGLLLV